MSGHTGHTPDSTESWFRLWQERVFELNATEIQPMMKYSTCNFFRSFKMDRVLVKVSGFRSLVSHILIFFTLLPPLPCHGFSYQRFFSVVTKYMTLPPEAVTSFMYNTLPREFASKRTAFRRPCREILFRLSWLRAWRDDEALWNGVSSPRSTRSTWPCPCSSCLCFQCALSKKMGGDIYMKSLQDTAHLTFYCD